MAKKPTKKRLADANQIEPAMAVAVLTVSYAVIIKLLRLVAGARLG
ncbi:MAG: hypothetical protein O7B79_15035 [SAR324 cluster bacterium]|nr:hypothetical protein [SAR324 cluster bacterium]